MRLNKFISNSGYCSRRKADGYIEAGLVHVNGEVEKQMGTIIDPTKDTVTINDKKIALPTETVTILLNKPTGYTSTKSDPYANQTIYDLLPKEFHTLHPIGRLDKNSEGLIILTNDGELTYELTHPKHDSSKTYKIRVKGTPTSAQIKKLEEGIDIEEEQPDGTTTTYHTQPCTIKTQNDPRSQNTNQTVLQVTLHEGRKRQIRKMFLSISHPVVYLKRLSMGSYHLGNLQKGQWKIHPPR